jgi:hypothetical protein
MGVVNSPLKKPVGRALIVGGASARSQPLAAMQTLGYECAEVDDPYAAAAELHRRPLVYRALVLSLASLFKEELGVVTALKKRLPHLEIWLTHIEGRQAALAETMRQGADGLLDEDGVLHRMAVTASEAPKMPVAEEVAKPAVADAHEMDSGEPKEGEPVLSAEELRALLAETPVVEEESEG